MKFNNITTGEKLSTTMYLTVVGKTNDGIRVKDSNGQEFEIRGQKLIEQSIISAKQFETESKISRTELANLLTGAGDAVFTAVFDKQDGSERTLVGKLVETENQMGRSNVMDLEVTTGTNMRQVDHRTLKSLIYKGVKYTVKK